ncbi:MAG: RecX family transcriptional regulator [Patescibacteria group bacterium]
MKITSIKQQIKQTGRYSVYVEGKYAFSLSADALIDSKLVNGQELTDQQVREYKQLSDDDKLYALTLRYIAIRPRSKWEIKQYLERKKPSPTLSDQLLNKLSIIALIDDQKFAQAYVNDRRLLRPTSRRKMILELRRKHIADEVIKSVVGDEPDEEKNALRGIIERKRTQTRYQDDLKLMQYLSRQGFGYGDIKSALQEE